MAALPILTEGDVRRRVGQASFDRGRRYFRDGALRDLRREGRTLRAACRGSLPEPYDLHASLGDAGVAEADCSCPVGDGGRCKHVAALLLAWLHRPEAFAEVEPVEDSLQRRSKEDLIALIRLMLARHPDLDDLVAMPPPGSAHEPLKAGVVMRQVRRVFAGDLYEWGSTPRVARDLEHIVRQADAYAAHGDWSATFTLCRAVLDGLIEHYEMLHDEGEVGDVVHEVVALLGRLLEHDPDADLHGEAVQALYDVVRWDLALGGVGMGDEAQDLLLAHATADERAGFAERTEAALGRLGTADDWGTRWQRKALGGLLLALSAGEDAAADEDEDARYLRICRAAGRTEDLVVRLLQRGRRDEALDAARAASDYDLLQLIPHFLDYGHGDALDALALERLGDGTDRRLVAWLKDRARERGDAALAQRLAERLFAEAPSVERYAEALDLSRALGHEDAVREALREHLRAERAYDVLAGVYLHDGEPDEALRLVYLPARDWRWPGARFQTRLRVAAAVAEARPEEALQLYLDAATDLIERRGRENYAEAARLLLEARAIYRRRGRGDDWKLLLREFRDAFKRLPALQDELRRAGL